MTSQRVNRESVRPGAIAAALTLLAAACVYLLRLDRVAGLVVDDAWYVLLGRALAQGDGYRLISSAAIPGSRS